MTYYSNPEIDDWQRQIIIGTILGGSSLVKPQKGRNCYLFMRSTDKNWLNYKANELLALASQRPFTQEGNTLRWHSNCYPVFTDYYNLFYVDGLKKICMEVLDRLRDIGLSIWYGDCGRLNKDKVILNTNKFGVEGTAIVSQYFSEAGIGETKIVKERKYIRLVFSEEASDKFLMTIANSLPDFMHEELLPK
jgi:hypothetical protein